MNPDGTPGLNGEDRLMKELQDSFGKMSSGSKKKEGRKAGGHSKTKRRKKIIGPDGKEVWVDDTDSETSDSVDENGKRRSRLNKDGSPRKRRRNADGSRRKDNGDPTNGDGGQPGEGRYERTESGRRRRRHRRPS